MGHQARLWFCPIALENDTAAAELRDRHRARYRGSKPAYRLPANSGFQRMWDHLKILLVAVHEIGGSVIQFRAAKCCADAIDDITAPLLAKPNSVTIPP